LTGKQKRRLRALGHTLGVVVQVGNNGVTEGVVGAVEQALEDHELVKVKVADEREGRAEAIGALAQQTGSEVAQVLGRTALLFRKRAKNSKFSALFKDDGQPVQAKLPQKKKGPRATVRKAGPDLLAEAEDERKQASSRKSKS
jgi:RNA-binding protein